MWKKDRDAVVSYLSTGLQRRNTSPEVQTFCIVAGLFLRDIKIDMELEPGDECPEWLPNYFENTTLTFSLNQTVLDACNRSLRQPAPRPAVRLPGTRQIYTGLNCIH